MNIDTEENENKRLDKLARMGPEVPVGACVGVCMWVCVCVGVCACVCVSI